MEANNIFKDLTGQKFSELTAIRYLGNRMWECECKYGHKKAVNTYSLTSGKSKICLECNTDKNKVRVGDTFNDWKVIDIIDSVKVLCRCSCSFCIKDTKGQREKAVNKYTLLSGKSKGCGRTKTQDRVIDMTKERYGKLVVEKYVGNSEWLCQCDCGGTKIVKRNKLLEGITTHCGCENNHGLINLEGMRFGKITVLEYIGNKTWKCECDCSKGKYKNIMSANLVNGSTISCGCIQNSFTTEELNLMLDNLTLELGRKPFMNEVANELKLHRNTIDYHLNKHGLKDKINSSFSSAGEREVASLFTDAILGTREIITPYELDIYLPSRNIAIEFNGDYWHSDKNKDSTYHQKKTIECAKKGVRLIHIFENEWNDDRKKSILLSILNNKKERIYGRETVIVQIGRECAKTFLEENHLQGHIDASMYFGCIHRKTNELVGVMSVSTDRSNTNHEYEIYRLAWKKNTIVIGGNSKIFKYFVNKFNVKSVFTYVDISKFTGNGYTRIGFNVMENPITKPGYYWYNSNTKLRLSRHQVQKHKLVKQGLGTAEQTEDEIMSELGFYKIYDSGNLRLEWHSEHHSKV